MDGRKHSSFRVLSKELRGNVLLSLVDAAQAHQGNSGGLWYDRILVNRSYADKYNLIACAIGHHIYESRWLRNPEYLNQIIHTWYRGNEGGPMAKMTKFSSWNADAVLGRYMVDGNKEFCWIW